MTYSLYTRDMLAYLHAAVTERRVDMCALVCTVLAVKGEGKAVCHWDMCFCNAGSPGAVSSNQLRGRKGSGSSVMDQARGPVLQRPLRVEDSIQFLHQRIQECNASLPYTGSSLTSPQLCQVGEPSSHASDGVHNSRLIFCGQWSSL